MACQGARGTWVGRAGPGGHLTLSPFTSAEGKQERSPRRRPPRSSSSAAQKTVRCSPAPSSPAPPLWCVAQAGPGRGGPTPWPGASTLNGARHTKLWGQLPSHLLPSLPSLSFPSDPGAPYSAPPHHSGGGKQPRPSCQASLAVGQTLLAASAGAAPSPTASVTVGLGSARRLGCC